ncbi:MAG: DUF202 domain-containing protein [Nocardioidaceae bacterium]
MTTPAGDGPQPGSGSEPWRPGYHVERTSLSWVRTALALLAASGAVARVGALEGRWWAVVLGVVGGGLCVALVVLSGARYRRTQLKVEADLDPRARWSVRAAVAGVVCAGLATLAMVVADLV